MSDRIYEPDPDSQPEEEKGIRPELLKRIEEIVAEQRALKERLEGEQQWDKFEELVDRNFGDIPYEEKRTG